MMRRLFAVWHARNLEFLRDRATLIFTLLLPIMLVIGMGFVFGGPQRPLFKVGVITPQIDKPSQPGGNPFLQERYVDFVPIASPSEGLPKITHQQIDLLLGVAIVLDDVAVGLEVERVEERAPPFGGQVALEVRDRTQRAGRAVLGRLAGELRPRRHARQYTRGRLATSGRGGL